MELMTKRLIFRAFSSVPLLGIAWLTSVPMLGKTPLPIGCRVDGIDWFKDDGCSIRMKQKREESSNFHWINLLEDPEITWLEWDTYLMDWMETICFEVSQSGHLEIRDDIK